MTDPSGTYTFTARYIGETQLWLNVDPVTGALSGTLGTGPDTSAVTGRWDDANSHITFNDAFAPGEFLFTHFFDGYVSQQVPSITGLAGTYHDFRINIAGGLVEFTEDSGGWCASRPAPIQ